MEPNRDPTPRSAHAEPVLTPPETAAARPPPPRRIRLPFVILGLVAIALIIAGSGYVFFTRNQETTDDAQVEADVVQLAPRVGGQVAEVLVRDNQRVRKGEPILKLDASDFDARLRQAQAELATARAQASAAEAQVRVVEANARGGFASAQATVSGSEVGVANASAQVAAARAAVARARADAQRALLDYQRAEQLVAANAVPRQQLDNAQLSYEAAQAGVDQARAQLRAAVQQRRAARTRVAEARGKLDQSEPIDAQIEAARANAELATSRAQVAEAALESAQLQRSYTTLAAPVDGLVSRYTVQPGDVVQAGQPVAQLVPDLTYLVANFKETQVGRMQPGEAVKVRVDAFPGRDFDGVVESLSGGTGARFSLLPPENATGNFVKVVQRVPVRIAWVRRPDLPMAAGMSAEVTVYVDRRAANASPGGAPAGGPGESAGPNRARLKRAPQGIE